MVTLRPDSQLPAHFKGKVTCKKIIHIWISCRACRFFFIILAVVLWVKNAVQNGLLPLPLFVFRLQSIWDGLHVTSSMVRLQSLRTLCTVRGFPVVASYVAWRADQVLYGSCTLDIDSNDIGSCVYLRKIALLAVKQEQRNTVDLYEN